MYLETFQINYSDFPSLLCKLYWVIFSTLSSNLLMYSTMSNLLFNLTIEFLFPCLFYFQKVYLVLFLISRFVFHTFLFFYELCSLFFLFKLLNILSINSILDSSIISSSCGINSLINCICWLSLMVIPFLVWFVIYFFIFSRIVSVGGSHMISGHL